jgi:chemotaxis protein methyltransferase CheR
MIAVACSRKIGDFERVRTSRQIIDSDDEAVQLKDLLNAVFKLYEVDFRSYALSSLKRRVMKHMHEEGLGTIRELQTRVLADAAALGRLVRALTVHVTAMFRDPAFYLAFREEAVPLLRTYPYLRFWIAGCSTGEEVYSLAILLVEEGLYERCRIYATDLSEQMIGRAQSGIFSVASMQEYTRNYQKAGGQRSFAEYYTADNDYVVVRSGLRRNIVFSTHNLVRDSSFNEFHVIFCRNVMIYFNRSLQERVHGLFYDSLLTFGYLGLGRSEDIRFTRHEKNYKAVAAPEKLFRKVL